MPVGVALQVAKARTVIAGLTPATSASTTWTEVPELLAWDDEHPAQERVFRVDLDDSPPELTETMEPAAAYFVSRFTVRMRWDSKSDHEAAAARVREDCEQIVHAMCVSTNYETTQGGTTIQLVEPAGGTLEQRDGFYHGTLVFACRYRRAF